MSKTARAFAPGAISSFFEICDTTADGKPLFQLERIGARGGGFGLCKGTTTEVTVTPAETSRIDIFINGQLAPQAQTSITVAKEILSMVKEQYDIVVEHQVEVPIGAGFGTSAGGALTVALSLKEALDIPLTFNRIGRIAHAAEIQCQTGLGTVSSLAQLGGCVLVVQPGAPGVCVLDRIPLTDDYIVVSGVFKSMPKHDTLNSTLRKAEIKRYGRKTLEKILAEPSLENFLACCWQFAQQTGFATERVRNLVALAKKAKAVGAAQNMLGEAVHAVVLEENAAGVAEAFKQVLPKDSILVSKIDFQGVRLVDKHAEVP